ncbi:unnamed protein product [Cylicostephanus goldi]|uniref:Small acidic protein-like domain-containing protein n=1 Tax=Cylicostephanus goldi TaxID=71465 RepID=A0A3P6R017_CYLGO|nr:unnamed protein product [Cylicostephanus goldi]
MYLSVAETAANLNSVQSADNFIFRPRRDDFGDRPRGRDRDNRGGRHDDRRRDDFRSNDRDDRDRFQRKDDRRDYGGPRRDYRGGGGPRRGGPDRGGDRDRGGRRRDDRRDRDDRSTWDVRPSAEEVAKQKKLLWGSKPAPAASGETSGAGAEAHDEVVDKNAGLWSSAITASGVAGEQANKFLKLMGIKHAPPVDPSTTDSKRLQEESEKQKKMMRDLDRQYEIARETTHMGRGLGLGFHQQ